MRLAAASVARAPAKVINRDSRVVFTHVMQVMRRLQAQVLAIEEQKTALKKDMLSMQSAQAQLISQFTVASMRLLGKCDGRNLTF